MKDMMNKMSGAPDSSEHDAKIQVLEELRELAMSMMGDKMKKHLSPAEKMQEVTVAAPDKESLSEGLELAQEVLPEMPEESEDDDMELDEIESMIRDLEEKKRAKLGQA